jgi:hypothetical protein
MQQQLLNNVVRVCCELAVLWLVWHDLRVWERLVGHSRQAQSRQRGPTRPRLAPDCVPVFTTMGCGYISTPSRPILGSGCRRQVSVGPSGRSHRICCTAKLHKVKVGDKLKAMYTVAVCGTRAQLRAALGALRLTGRIMTAYVERVHLTLRKHIAPLSRRIWSLVRDQRTLWRHIEWGRAYYHFGRYHQSWRLATSVPHRYRARTPTMAAGLTHRRWRVRELLLRPLPELAHRSWPTAPAVCPLLTQVSPLGPSWPHLRSSLPHFQFPPSHADQTSYFCGNLVVDIRSKTSWIIFHPAKEPHVPILNFITLFVIVVRVIVDQRDEARVLPRTIPLITFDIELIETIYERTFRKLKRAKARKREPMK